MSGSISTYRCRYLRDEGNAADLNSVKGPGEKHQEGEARVCVCVCVCGCVDLSSIGLGRRPKGVQRKNQPPAHKNCRSHCCLNSRDCAQTESGGLKQLGTLDIGVQCRICCPRAVRGDFKVGEKTPCCDRDNLVQVENNAISAG